MYIQLDVGWLRHPFPVSSFRIASADQIATLRGLGLPQVRCILSKTDPEVALALLEPSDPPSICEPREADAAPVSEPTPVAETDAAYRRRVLDAQNHTLAVCNKRFADSMLHYNHLAEAALTHPTQARAQTEAMVSGCVSDLLDNGESVIRLLSEVSGERSALHSVNVMVVSLLLGRALGMSSQDLHDLGIAALAHDLGKLRLPTVVAEPVPSFSPSERVRYESHVSESVAIANQMGLSDGARVAIAQHHEMADGSGFPKHLGAGQMTQISQVLALVNYYDRICNPAHGVAALTPHEALSVMFAQHKSRFDAVVLGAFIRMMGVYPPGSIVQLVNDQFALVASVNSSRPLRPRVIVYDRAVPRDEALVLDLETTPDLGIRRSLKPAQLPRDALDYLSPRRRVCYFFERAVEPLARKVDP